MASLRQNPHSKVSLGSLSATHLLYNGYDLYTISQLLGHTSIENTTIYLHIVPARFADLKSPFDFLELNKEDGDAKR